MATHNALTGSSHQHIISSAPAQSTEPLLPLAIQPALHLRHPNFMLLQPDSAETSLSMHGLQQLVRDLRLELDLACLHLEMSNETIRIYQAQLVISAAHSRCQQKQLAAREEKGRKTGSNTIIKPDASKGHLISCEEAEQFEIAQKEAIARKEAEKEAK